MQTNVVLLECRETISVHRTLSPFRFSRPEWKRLCDRSSRFFHFSTCACDQNIGWPHRDDDLSKGPIFDHARRKPDHEWAGDACAVRDTTKRDFFKKKKNNSDITCFSSPPLELEARQKLNHLWLLRSFWMFAMCSVGSSKAKAGAVEAWTRGFQSRL